MFDLSVLLVVLCMLFSRLLMQARLSVPVAVDDTAPRLLVQELKVPPRLYSLKHPLRTRQFEKVDSFTAEDAIYKVSSVN